jgi:hypothetical protein
MRWVGRALCSAALITSTGAATMQAGKQATGVCCSAGLLSHHQLPGASAAQLHCFRLALAHASDVSATAIVLELLQQGQLCRLIGQCALQEPF